jgi:hypothetical protein
MARGVECASIFSVNRRPRPSRCKNKQERLSTNDIKKKYKRRGPGLEEGGGFKQDTESPGEKKFIFGKLRSGCKASCSARTQRRKVAAEEGSAFWIADGRGLRENSFWP